MRRRAPKKLEARFVRCHWCKWTAGLSAKTLDKKGSGWRQLWEHVAERHPSRAKEVRGWARN